MSCPRSLFIAPFIMPVDAIPVIKSQDQRRHANIGIALISLFTFVDFGNAPVQSIKPLPSVVPLPKSAILPIASANFPFHLP